jgi:hypothetical protein
MSMNRKIEGLTMPSVSVTLSVPADWRSREADEPRTSRAFYGHAEGCAACAAILDSPEALGPDALCPAGRPLWDALVAAVGIGIGAIGRHKA